MTTASANGTTAANVFDLEDAAKAAATEAEGQPFAFTYHGEHYEVPPGRKWPVSALSALSAGDLEAALGTLLGADTFAKLAAAGLTVGELNVLFAKLGQDAGFPSLPNSPSPAPPSSSQP